MRKTEDGPAGVCISGAHYMWNVVDEEFITWHNHRKHLSLSPSK